MTRMRSITSSMLLRAIARSHHVLFAEVAMGVLGLWTLLDPAGKPVPVESLSHKVLAVDISIWLNQAVRGFRDKQGNAVPHAHLLGLYHRICKLLFYRFKLLI